MHHSTAEFRKRRLQSRTAEAEPSGSNKYRRCEFIRIQQINLLFLEHEGYAFSTADAHCLGCDRYLNIDNRFSYFSNILL